MVLNDYHFSPAHFSCPHIIWAKVCKSTWVNRMLPLGSSGGANKEGDPISGNMVVLQCSQSRHNNLRYWDINMVQSKYVQGRICSWLQTCSPSWHAIGWVFLAMKTSPRFKMRITHYKPPQEGHPRRCRQWKASLLNPPRGPRARGSKGDARRPSWWVFFAVSFLNLNTNLRFWMQIGAPISTTLEP